MSAVPDPTGIYGGHEVNECGWPTVAHVRTTDGGSCSGTLIHPELVIYAAHCGTLDARVRLGQGTGGGLVLPVDFCKLYEGGYLGTNTDFAFCRLTDPVEYFPIVPPLMGCESDVLTPGREVVLAGFGLADNGPVGPKREVTTVLRGIDEYGEALIGGGGKDACNGDSGGPAFVRLAEEDGGDGSWRVFGVASFGSNCGAGTYYGVMSGQMEWLESESGLDLTPCHDADGTWNPGPSCREFAMDPQTGGGSWGTGCHNGPVSDWAATCGAPFSTGDDDVPPTVTIIAPEHKERFDTGGTGIAKITIEIGADDGSGLGVDRVQLVIDGAAVDNGEDPAPPYVFEDVELPQGTWSIGALAWDYAGNEAESAVVVVGVDEDPDVPEPPDGETGDGKTEDGDDGGGAPDDGDTAGDDTGASGGASGAEPGGCGCRGSAPVGPLLTSIVVPLWVARRRRASRCARRSGQTGSRCRRC